MKFPTALYLFQAIGMIDNKSNGNKCKCGINPCICGFPTSKDKSNKCKCGMVPCICGYHTTEKNGGDKCKKCGLEPCICRYLSIWARWHQKGLVIFMWQNSEFGGGGGGIFARGRAVSSRFYYREAFQIMRRVKWNSIFSQKFHCVHEQMILINVIMTKL